MKENFNVNKINKQAHDITMLYLSKSFECNSKDAVRDILEDLIQEYQQVYDYICEQLQEQE